jgi:hypothetical protein
MSLNPNSAATNNPVLAQERAQMESDLAQAKDRLEALRKRERDELRPALVRALHTLTYDSCLAKHKIETRQFADGVTGLDVAFDRMKDAETALVDIVNEIELARAEVADLERDLSDRALWADDSAAITAEVRSTLAMLPSFRPISAEENAVLASLSAMAVSQ